MILGHAFAVFAIVGVVASYRYGRKQALAIGAVAGAFSFMPDVDMVFAAIGIARALDGAAPIAAFWAASLPLHRAGTHSLVLAPIAIGAITALTSAHRRYRLLGLGTMAGIVAIAAGLAGIALAVVSILYFAVGTAIIMWGRKMDLPPHVLAVAGLTALWIHPLTDLFTGTPPRLLYPLPVRILEEHLWLSHDPTLHLLGIFALEVVAILSGIVVLAMLFDRTPHVKVSPIWLVGITYAGAIILLPHAPTLDQPYLFTATILPLGGLALGVDWFRYHRHGRALDGLLIGSLSCLGAVMLATTAFAIAYLWV